MSLINDQALWEKVREYNKNLTATEKVLLKEMFDSFLSANDVELRSPADYHTRHDQFELAWMMCSVWHKLKNGL